jgi:uncharacterized protein YggE
MSLEESGGKLYWVLVILSIALVIIAAGLYSYVAGDFRPAADQKVLSVSGSASKFIIPDTASLSIGVITQAPTARDASEKNALKMDAVITSLKSLGLKDKEIRTSLLSIQPVYIYPKEGGIPTIEAYSVSNNIQVTTSDMLANLSDIVDRSISSGANQVSGISFAVSEKNQKEIREELLEEAVNDAEAKARMLAESLNVRIVGVKTSSIVESGFLQPIQTAAAFAEKIETPIQPGESQVTVAVQVTFMID